MIYKLKTSVGSYLLEAEDIQVLKDALNQKWVVAVSLVENEPSLVRCEDIKACHEVKDAKLINWYKHNDTHTPVW